MIQETLNFAITHHLRVLLVIEQNELADPVEIGFLCSIAVLLRPDFCANRLQKR
jgi:TPP-dependent pyruvate/acetoin dehydrogenase alpha subunit